MITINHKRKQKFKQVDLEKKFIINWILLQNGEHIKL